MKRRIVYSMSLLLLGALVLVVVSGCGETSKSKQYMNAGDNYLRQLGPKTDKLSGDMLAMLKDFQDGKLTTIEAFNSRASGIKANIEEHDKLLAKAKAEFGKMLALKGTGDYEVYAKVRLRAIDNAKQLPEAASAVVAETEKAVRDVQSGKLSGGDALSKKAIELATKWVQKDQEVSGKAAIFSDGAKKIKSKAKL